MSDHAEPKAKTIKVPGPDHPITIERNPSRVVVSVAGRFVADTRDALTLREASYPAVQYVPRKDVDMTLLERTDRVTYCPYKGDCAYYSIPLGGERSINAVWTYEEPYAAVAAIKDHVAFYPGRAFFKLLSARTTKNRMNAMMRKFTAMVKNCPSQEQRLVSSPRRAPAT
jgi:uncharacterized protein (DUF427 family)